MLDTYLADSRARLAGLAALCVLAACGPGPAEETATDAEPTTSSTGDGSTTDPTTGGELDCAAVPTVLDTPQWSAEPTSSLQAVVAGPDGDAVLLGAQGLTRIGAGGEVWTHAFTDAESPQAIEALPDGRILVGGWFFPGPKMDAELLLALVGPAGERLATASFDIAPGRSDLLQDLTVNAVGDIFTISLDPQQDDDASSLRIDRFDAALAHVWSADAGPYRFSPTLAADDEGNSYLAAAELLDIADFTHSWLLEVRSFAPDGSVRWEADDVAFVTDLEVVDVDVGLGDRVYVLASSYTAFAFTALSTTGEASWTKLRSWGETPSEPVLADHWLQAVVASPCGGAYVGGRADVEVDFVSERASLFHVAADGSFGPVTHLLEEPMTDGYTFGVTDRLDVSPSGRIVAGGSLYADKPDGPGLLWVRGY